MNIIIRFYSKYNVSCIDFVRSSPAPRHNCALGPRDQVVKNTTAVIIMVLIIIIVNIITIIITIIMVKLISVLHQNAASLVTTRAAHNGPDQVKIGFQKVTL